MRAFISYSLNDAEQYILSILANKLTEQGFVVSASYTSNPYSNLVDYYSFNEITTTNLFIGIITYTGTDNQRVLNEWKLAVERKIPALLLIEENVQVGNGLINHQNVIRFNRTNPHYSIDLVRQKIEQSRQTQISQQTNNNTAWLLGGLALLALIGLLSKKD